ncbi:MAG: glycosyltransferase [Oscillospiraceae bacterium]|nr:glycosyltransferase [Oscillospiraceae bacterium]
MSTPKLSVIVPVYNVKPYINECVDSLLDQDIEDYEIILVDDGSDDGSESICDEYADSRRNVCVIHKSNGGLGSARNFGVRAATGKYILFIDSDDYFEPNSLGKLIEIAERDKLDILLYGAQSFSDNAEVPVMNHYKRTKGFDVVLRGRDAIAKSYKVNEYITSICLRMYRLEYLRSLNLLFNEHIIHEDEDVSFLSYIQAERTEIIPDKLYKRRYREGSILNTRRYQKVLEGYGYAIHQVSRFFDNCSWSLNEKMACMKYCEFKILNLLGSYSELDKKERKENRKALQDLIKREKKHYKYYKKLVPLGRFVPDILILLNKMRNATIAYRPVITMLREEPRSIMTVFSIKKAKGRRIFLIGTPRHGNLGDHLIAESEMQFYAKYIPEMTVIECSMRFSRAFLPYIKKHIRKDDIIAISGGGWLGTEWRIHEDFVRKIISEFPNNRIVIMPQTAFYKNDIGYLELGIKIYKAHKDLYFCARESNTFKLITDNGFCMNSDQALLVPDMALLTESRYSMTEKCSRSGNVGFCFRDDVEVSITKETRDTIINFIEKNGFSWVSVDTILHKGIGNKERSIALSNKLNEIASLQLLITDRLHAMVMAALTGTPCIAFDNSTHKVEGVYNWIKELEYIKYVDSPELLECAFEELQKLKNQNFFRLTNCDEYKKQIAELFC